VADLWVCELGLVPFAQALALQEALRAARQADALPDTLLLLEHPPVYTRGRRSGADELPAGSRFLGATPIEVVDVDRGGRVTYHGPGQLVGYPIMRIGDILGYLRSLERAIVAALDCEGVRAQGGGDRPTGVWTAGRKIASIGVHVSRRVTTHGFAVNADNELAPFAWIVPCGLPGVEMTSIGRETGRAGTLAGFRANVVRELARSFERRAVALAPEELADALAAPVG
jgi:lipoyl(octanoyl) transferase